MTEESGDVTLRTYLQSFDTTLAQHLNEAEALGALNFALIFHEQAFIGCCRSLKTDQGIAVLLTEN